MHRSVKLLALPLPDDRIPLQFWKEGVRVRSRAFLLDGSVVLELEWHGFDDENAAEQLHSDGWEQIEAALWSAWSEIGLLLANASSMSGPRSLAASTPHTPIRRSAEVIRRGERRILCLHDL